MNNKKLAKELLVLAKNLNAYRETDDVEEIVKEKGFDINELELKDQIKLIARLAEKFQETHEKEIEELEKFKREREAKIEALKKEIADAEKPIKDAFSQWSKVGESKYNKLTKTVLENARAKAEMGDDLEELSQDIEGIKISEEESERDSYKIKYEMLITTLHNQGEYQKYSDILDNSAAKVRTNLDTGLKLLDKSINSWQEDLKKVAEERDLSWKDLLTYTFTKNMRRQEKTSGIGDIVKTIASFTKKAFKKMSMIWDKINDSMESEYEKSEKAWDKLNEFISDCQTLAKEL